MLLTKLLDSNENRVQIIRHIERAWIFGQHLLCTTQFSESFICGKHIDVL